MPPEPPGATIAAMERLPHPDGGALAADVDRRDPARWWVVVHGFGSVRGGAKATALRAAAAHAGASFLAFDARGHGASSGSIEDLTLSHLVRDLDVAVEAVVPAGADLLAIGSSLGGLATAWWTVERPGRARAAVLVAPAFGFVARFLADIGPEAAAAWARTGRLTYRNEWMTVPLRHDLVVDAAARSDARLAARYATDTLIVHGARDERVPWRVSADFVAACPHRPLDLHLLGDGDHRLTTRLPDLAHLVATVARDGVRRAP